MLEAVVAGEEEEEEKELMHGVKVLLRVRCGRAVAGRGGGRRRRGREGRRPPRMGRGIGLL